MNKTMYRVLVVIEKLLSIPKVGTALETAFWLSLYGLVGYILKQII